MDPGPIHKNKTKQQQKKRVRTKSFTTGTHLCQRLTATAVFYASCHRTPFQSRRGLRCIGPTQCPGAGPLSGGGANPFPPVTKKMI